MSKRSHRSPGTGSLTLRVDGAYIARVTVPGTGKRRKRIIQPGRQPDGRPETPAQFLRRANRELADFQAEALATAEHVEEVPTFGVYATGLFKRRLEEGEIKQTTYDHYERIGRLYVLPSIAHRRLNEITPYHLEVLDKELRSGKRPKSRTTRRHARTYCNQVFAEAMRDDLVEKVVSKIARAPGKGPALKPTAEPKVVALNADQIRALLTSASGSRLEPLFAVLGLLGLRIGEALGLAWDAVDLDTSTLRIRRNLVVADGGLSLTTPKTEASSMRTVTMPPGLSSTLRRWRQTQRQERLAAPGWDERFGVDFVFTDEVGRPLSRSRVRSGLLRAAEDAGIGHISPHRLRHSAGSIALAAGTPIPEVTRMLGHANSQITLNTYAHALDDGQRAVDAVADAVGSWTG